jgi:DNA-binding CsgD family transcriptional regulator
VPALTERERDILARVAAGMTTAAISRELWVSEHTIKFHLTNIYRKLGVPNRAGAVRYALDHGLV